MLLHQSLQKYREMFRVVKLKKEINENVITGMAAIGHNKAQIQRALGFNKDHWNKPEIQEAFDEGRSALEGALLTKQVSTALDGSEKLLTHLGKHVLGQHDGPTVAVQVNNNGDGNTTVSIRDKMAEARKRTITQLNETTDVIDAEIVEPGKDE